MTRYHLSRNGEPGICKAEVDACPLGGEHFDNFEAANEASQLKFLKEHGAFDTFKKASPLGANSRRIDDGSEVLTIQAAEAELFNEHFGNNAVEGESTVGPAVHGGSDVDRLEFNVRDAGFGDGDTEETREQIAEFMVSTSYLAKHQLGKEGRSAFVEWASSDPAAKDIIKGNLVIEDTYYGRSFKLPLAEYK